MGTRSRNYIALAPSVQPTGAFYGFMTENLVSLDERGSLIVFESNFCPMWARQQHDECTLDLEEEVMIHRFLGSLPASSFYMKRAGEDCGDRGEWKEHPFKDHEEVKDIDAQYVAELADDTVEISKEDLAALLDMAKEHVGDVESGLEDGIYDAEENQDIGGKRQLVDRVDELYREKCIPKTQTISP